MIKEQKEIQYNRPQVLIGPPLVILLTEHGIYEDYRESNMVADHLAKANIDRLFDYIAW